MKKIYISLLFFTTLNIIISLIQGLFCESFGWITASWAIGTLIMKEYEGTEN